MCVCMCVYMCVYECMCVCVCVCVCVCARLVFCDLETTTIKRPTRLGPSCHRRKKKGIVHINIILRRVRITTVAMEEQ